MVYEKKVKEPLFSEKAEESGSPSPKPRLKSRYKVIALFKLKVHTQVTLIRNKQFTKLCKSNIIILLIPSLS